MPKINLDPKARERLEKQQEQLDSLRQSAVDKIEDALSNGIAGDNKPLTANDLLTLAKAIKELKIK